MVFLAQFIVRDGGGGHFVPYICDLSYYSRQQYGNPSHDLKGEIA